MKKLIYIIVMMTAWVACTDDDTTYDDLTTAEEINLAEYFAIFDPSVNSSYTTRGSYTNEDNNLRQFGLACRGSLDFDTITVTLTPLIDIYIEVKYAYSQLALNLYSSSSDSITYLHSHYSRDSIWWPDTLMRWEDKVTSAESLRYIAISPYPYREQKDFLKFESLGTIDVGVESNQKTYSDASNDLLLFRDTVNVFNELTDYGEIPVIFKHLMSKLKLVVIMDTTYNTQFAYDTDEMLATENDIDEGKDTIMIYSDNYPNGRVLLTTRYNPINNIEIEGFITTGTLDLSVAQPKVDVSSTSTTTIYPGEDSLSYEQPFMYNDTAKAVYEAVVVPQTVSSIGITLGIGSYIYSYELSENITFEPGYNYTITLPVKPEATTTTSESSTDEESSSEAKGNTKLSEERRVKSEESPHKVMVALSPGDIKTTTW